MRQELLSIMFLCASSAMARDYVVTEFGAVGDGVTDNTSALQATIDKCSADSGGRVIFPSGGKFLSGPLEMKSYVNLYLEPNSVLFANPDESVYRLSAFGVNEGEGMMWLWGKDIENFSISGTGKIDGNAIAFMGAELDDSY